MLFRDFCDSNEKNLFSFIELYSLGWQLLVDHTQKHVDDTEIYGPDSFEVDINSKTLKEKSVLVPADEVYLLPQTLASENYEDDFIYTAGILLAELFFGTTINNRSVLDVYALATEDPENSLFIESDFEQFSLDFVSEDVKKEIANYIILMTSFSAEKRSKGAEGFALLGKGLGCEYEITCCAPDGSAETVFNVPVEYNGLVEAVWPEKDPPIEVLSDGNSYSIMTCNLSFLPGRHKLSARAICLVETKVEENEPDFEIERNDVVDFTHNNEDALIGPENVIGLDLGTETTCMVNGLNDVISLDSYSEIIPSVLFFETNNKVTIGNYAKNRSKLYPKSAIRGFKRYIGEQALISENLQAADGSKIRCTGSVASTLFVTKLTNALTEAHDTYFKKIVVTVPAMFDPVRRRATIDAIMAAGYEKDDVRLVPEPVAAAMFYDCESMEGTTAVFDIGGGTYDFALIRDAEVIESNGDLKIGGMDFTNAIIDIIKEKCIGDGYTLPDRSPTESYEVSKLYQILYDCAETAKIELSVQTSTTVQFTNYHGGAPVELSYVISRSEFENKISEKLFQIKKITLDTLSNAGCTADSVDRVVIMGGSSVIPCIDKLIRSDLFSNCNCFFDQDRICAVARGAAKYASNFWCKDNNNDDVDFDPTTEISGSLSYDLGIITSDRCFECILEKGTVYTDNGAVKKREFNFRTRNQNQVEVPVYIRSQGCTRDRLPLMANKDSGFTKIGQISFANINFENMFDNALEVEVGVDTGGAMVCHAYIINRETKDRLESVDVEIAGV